jgi:hypothetical protein
MTGLLGQDYFGSFQLGEAPSDSKTVEQALRKYLVDLTAVPVFYARRPQAIEDMPCIVFEKVSEERMDTTDGASGSATYTYILRIWSMNPDTTLTLAAAIRRSLDGYRGLMWSRFVPTAWLESEDDDIQDLGDGSDEYVYGRHSTYVLRVTDQN